jgi:hypothetical protein
MGLILPIIINCLIIPIVIASSKSTSKESNPYSRINCYPETESPYSNYSKESCLSRNCLYDDEANSSSIQCYLSPNYGYILQDSIKQIDNILQLKLKRNSAINSIFPEPIENVILEVQYYTNDIIRFKLYDADQQRYEVTVKRKRHENIYLMNLGTN